MTSFIQQYQTGLIWLMGVIFLLVLYWLWQNRPRYCTHDGTKMQKVDGVEKFRCLNEGQAREEGLGSQVHTVLVCSVCRYTLIRSKRTLFSKFKECKFCGYHCVRKVEEIEQQESEYTDGVLRFDNHCLNCEEKYESRVPLVKTGVDVRMESLTKF